MLLSEEEEWKLWNAQGIDDMNQAEAIAFARAYAAAILAKLAAKELPEPQKYPADCFMREVNVCDALAVSIAIQQAHAQGFAAGAAAQLAEKPKCWAIFTEDGNARMWSTFQPHVQKLADAEGLAVTELYTRREK